MYSYIGHTYFSKATDVLVGDPGICELHDIIFSFPEINKKVVIVEQISEGGYYSYHAGSASMPAIAEELLFLKDVYGPEDLKSLVCNEIGTVCTAFTSSVFICDKEKAFNANYCYYVLESDAYYSSKDIADVLSGISSLSEVEKELLELCLAHNDNIYITGQQIADITGLSAVPEFLRNILSTHWSTDIAHSLFERPAVSIIGGAASNSGCGLLRVYALLDADKVVGIRVLLDANECDIDEVADMN